MLRGLLDEIDPRPLGLARVIVGFAAFIRLWVALPELLALTRSEVLLIPYASWIPEPTTPLVTMLAAVWGLSAALFTLGWRVPLSGSLLFLAIAGTLAIDQQVYANHLYLMAWLVFLFTLARSGAGLNIHRRDTPVVRWPVLLIMAQLSIVYGFSALTKMNETFLSGKVLAGYMGTGVVHFPEGLRTPGFLGTLAAGALFVELFIAIFIWRSRFRPTAFILGFGLHLSIVLFMADTSKLLVFTLEMLALYPLFLPGERLTVSWNEASPDAALMGWMRRMDVLRLLEPSYSPTNSVVAGEGSTTTSTGFDAIERILERVVPTLWVAPILRLPGIRGLGRRWYRRSRSEGQPVST